MGESLGELGLKLAQILGAVPGQRGPDRRPGTLY